MNLEVMTMTKIWTPVNQNGQAVQIATYDPDAYAFNGAIGEAVQIAEDIDRDGGRVLVFSSNIDYMVSIFLGDAETLTDSNAQYFVSPGYPFYLQVPGSGSTVTANKWHVYVKGRGTGASGRISIMEVESNV